MEDPFLEGILLCMYEEQIGTLFGQCWLVSLFTLRTEELGLIVCFAKVITSVGGLKVGAAHEYLVHAVNYMAFLAGNMF